MIGRPNIFYRHICCVKWQIIELAINVFKHWASRGITHNEFRSCFVVPMTGKKCEKTPNFILRQRFRDVALLLLPGIGIFNMRVADFRISKCGSLEIESAAGAITTHAWRICCLCSIVRQQVALECMKDDNMCATCSIFFVQHYIAIGATISHQLQVPGEIFDKDKQYDAMKCRIKS